MLFELFIILSFSLFLISYLGNNNPIYFILAGIGFMVLGAFVIGDNIQIRTGDQDTTTQTTTDIINYTYAASNLTGTLEIIKTKSNSTTTQDTTKNNVFVYANTPAIGAVQINIFIGFVYIFFGLLQVFTTNFTARPSKL